MATFISNSPTETERFAAEIGSRASPGMVLGLVGDLGAGKTQFVKGFARGLGIHQPVLSPTFALVHVYTGGRVPLYHVDFYRLDSPEQIAAAGLEECFRPEAIAVVEWWDRWQGADPPGLWRFEFETLSETRRRVTYADPGC